MKTMDKTPKPADHLANERTFLAWIRTGIAIMAFGFVVVKFALFVKQITYILGDGHSHTTLPNRSYSAAIGIGLVVLGTIMSLLGFYRYRSVEKQLQEQRFVPSFTLLALLTVAIILVGLLLVIYLLPSFYDL